MSGPKRKPILQPIISRDGLACLAPCLHGLWPQGCAIGICMIALRYMGWLTYLMVILILRGVFWFIAVPLDALIIIGKRLLNRNS